MLLQRLEWVERPIAAREHEDTRAERGPLVTLGGEVVEDDNVALADGRVECVVRKQAPQVARVAKVRA